MRRMGRRAFIAQTLALALFGAVAEVRTAYGGATSTLLDSTRLKLELRTTTQAQSAFVDDVVDKAKKGILPVKILAASYTYAMKHEASRRPLYFKICLEHLTKQAGLKITFLSF